ncbi:hypothetical protein FZEAL_7568 [Fusarium zealandicum]|uniref:Uncharacterized protein n=1 Tax=Fusarium zealandicum TaxID=1053134 RepID=A0A8H4UGI1_9HYPO|nr:hypothetical protein FZEAL_7568 [Fusarium zealandicum]
MHFTSIVISFTALALGASALPAVSTAPNPGTQRYVQLRTWSEDSCSIKGNLGQYGVYDNQIKTCLQFNKDDTVLAARVEYNPRLCRVSVHTDLKCRTGSTLLPLDRCINTLKKNHPLRSYSVNCDPQ